MVLCFRCDREQELNSARFSIDFRVLSSHLMEKLRLIMDPEQRNLPRGVGNRYDINIRIFFKGSR